MYLLIIESDPSIRKALRMGMAQAGWGIDAVCADIACITDMFSCHQYNIIIVDLDVKNRSILDSIRNVKKEQRQLIVVGITGGGIDEFFLEEDTGFVNACYQKPIHLHMLKKAIDLEFENQESYGSGSLSENALLPKLFVIYKNNARNINYMPALIL